MFRASARAAGGSGGATVGWEKHVQSMWEEPGTRNFGAAPLNFMGPFFNRPMQPQLNFCDALASAYHHVLGEGGLPPADRFSKTLTFRQKRARAHARTARTSYASPGRASACTVCA